MADEISIDRMAYKSAITENDFFLEVVAPKRIYLVQRKICGGDDRSRTGHLLHAKQSLYQLSYIPTLIGIGADDGNRTRVSSLGSYSSTIELHPQ